MALNFPTSPSNGDTHVFLGTTYTYDSSNDRWSAQSASTNGTVISSQASDPTARDDGAALQEGDIYYNTTDDAIKSYDGAAWNAVGGGSAYAEFISRGSFANAGSVEITLSGSYDVYNILLTGVRQASTNVLYYARFKSGATTYSADYYSNNNMSETYIYLGYSDGNADNIGISGDFKIFKPHDTSVYTHSTFMGGMADNERWQQTSNRDYGGFIKETVDITSVLIDTSHVDNFTHGTWSLYGVNT